MLRKNLSILGSFLILFLIQMAAYGYEDELINRSKRQAAESRGCNIIRCTLQGTECVERRGIGECVCRSQCRLPQGSASLICASNGQTYYSRCHMDRSACLNGHVIKEVECRNQPTQHQVPAANQATRTYHVSRGETVTFNCDVSGSPRPNLFWKRAGQVKHLRSGNVEERITISVDSTSFTFAQITEDDAGVYICHAHNRAGSLNIYFNLEVRGNSEARTPPLPPPTWYQKCTEDPMIQEPRCYEPTSGLRRRTFWTHNPRSGRCEEKEITDCHAVFNKYANEEVCRSTCVDICNLEPVQGPCNRFSTRVYFNQARGVCQPFAYGGCLGNPNNFENADACRQRCQTASPRQLPQPQRQFRRPGCPTCTRNMGTSYCDADFVLSGRVKKIRKPFPGATYKRVEFLITKVYKDVDRVFSSLNQHSPERLRHRIIHLQVESKCPCPDFKNMLHGQTIRTRSGMEVGSSYCSEDDLRRLKQGESNSLSSSCKEIIVSGAYVFGFPTITQGSLAVQATLLNSIRMRSNSRSPAMCQILNRMRSGR